MHSVVLVLKVDIAVGRNIKSVNVYLSRLKYQKYLYLEINEITASGTNKILLV